MSPSFVFVTLAVCGLPVAAQSTTAERPLAALPYTPSLDPSAMDRSVDPCKDFYRYSCGNWIKQNPIPPDQSRWDVYRKLSVDNMRFLWGILEEAARPDAGRGPVRRQIGDYFAACMDETAVERAGLTPLRPVLDRIAALRSVKQAAELLAELHRDERGRGTMFGFGSNQDFTDSTRVIAFATAGGLGLPDRDYYTKTDAKSVETRSRYADHVRAMLELAGSPEAEARAGAQTVMDIETALAKVSLTRVEQRDPYKLVHLLTRRQLGELTPAFDWNAYLAASGIANIREVNVTEPEFFKALNALLESRPLGDWQVYLRWHALHGAAAYLPKRFEDADFQFYSAYLHGVREQRPRWKRCVGYVDRDLGEALGRIFVEKTFAPETKQRAVAMTREIEKAMEADIHELSWMSPETKAHALEKLHSMVNKVGYPDKWRDYSSIRIARNTLFENVRNATAFESRRQLAKIGKPLDRGEWDMTPPTVNAYYNPQMNDINFPAGVLQPPLFDPKMDDAPNYGNTGSTIGHELTHGFDDEGRQFDAQGNLKDWWTKKDAEEFSQRAACVADQYAQYTIVDDIKINSRLTMGEDVADLGGTMLAYVAWRNATSGRKLKPADGLTPEQRFFVGFAQWACGDERPETKRADAIVNPHSPLEYRINGVVSNMPQFADAFACKAGQPMVRARTCRVW